MNRCHLTNHIGLSAKPLDPVPQQSLRGGKEISLWGNYLIKTETNVQNHNQWYLTCPPLTKSNSWILSSNWNQYIFIRIRPYTPSLICQRKILFLFNLWCLQFTNVSPHTHFCFNQDTPSIKGKYNNEYSWFTLCTSILFILNGQYA